jgi:hypothetical protein
VIHTLIICKQNDAENLMFQPLDEFCQYVVLHDLEDIIHEKEDSGYANEISEKLPYLFDLIILRRLNNICSNKGNRIGLHNGNA